MPLDTPTLPGRTRVRDVVIGGVLQRRILQIDAAEARACAALWATGDYSHLHLGSYENPGLASVECLREFRDVTRLELMLLDAQVDLSPLSAHAATLVEFSCNDDENALLDCTEFHALASLHQTWRPAVRFGSCTALRSLSLNRYAPKEKHLGRLPDAPELRALNLLRPGVAALMPLVRWPRLEAVRVTLAPRLHSVGELAACGQLKELVLDGCRQVTDLRPSLEQLTTLERLTLEKCADLPDIRFVERMPRLAQLNLLDTAVLDGDMTPLVKHPSLRHIVFTSRPHHSHTEAQVRALLETQHGESARGR